LTPGDIERMRAHVFAAARADGPVLSRRFIAVAAAATLATVAAIIVVARNPHPQIASDSRTPASPEAVLPATRQLQFEVPGGTRVIWTFNPDFEVR
jgi:hypothetical protein